ncbi:MAG: hypothetical protein ACM3PV_06270, partial [Betaproteobacteria bacterium]
MSRRGPLAVCVFVTLSLAACRGSQNNLLGSVQSRPPSADSVLVFVSSSWAPEPGQPRELLATNADGTKVERLTACAEAAQPCDMLQVALAPDRNR